MSNFLTSSIGKKVIMSLSGLFLISFLCVHLALNLLLIFDNSGALFNQGAHFMATNPIIKIIEPILAIGFIIHIIWASVLTLQNQKARPRWNMPWETRVKMPPGLPATCTFWEQWCWSFWWSTCIISGGTLNSRLWELRCQPLQSEVLKWKILIHWFPAYSNQALYTVWFIFWEPF